MDDDNYDDDTHDELDDSELNRGEPLSRRVDPADQTGGVRIIGATEAGGSAGDDRPVLRFPSPLPDSGLPDPSRNDAGPTSSRQPVWAEDSTSDAPADTPQDEGTFELPHYSDPPTGQIPKIVIGDGVDPSESWSGQPRWRDQNDEGADANFDDLDSSGPRLGALGNAEDFEANVASSSFFDPEDDLSGGPLPTQTTTDLRPPGAPPIRRQRQRHAPRVTDDPLAATPPSAGRNMPQAIAVGVGLLALGFLCFKLGAVATTILIAAVLTLAAGEFFATVRRAHYNPATLLGVVSVACFAIAPLIRPAVAFPVVSGITMIAGLVWFFWVSPGEGAVMNLGVTLLGIGWIGGLGSFATLLLGQAKPYQDAIEAAGAKNASNLGLGVIIAIVLITVSYDAGGFFVGKYLGHTPLSAASPNKTLEGLAGGVVAAIVVPVIILHFLPGVAPVGQDLIKSFFFCLFCAIAAPLGDLCQSALKRDLGVKDMGDLLPGHGGVLDRFDAFLFVIPMAWIMAQLLHIGVPGFTY